MGDMTEDAIDASMELQDILEDITPGQGQRMYLFLVDLAGSMDLPEPLAQELYEILDDIEGLS